ncbi:MAG TPA: LodA/GoxA family CTQ-dependent oxidase [Gemmataceae bacterium]|jgi:hypothetical protein|nr:LodA/GoxA family CTQ-dependent oxidase [Gemmataceae bacterium]
MPLPFEPTVPLPPCNCDTDPIAGLKKLFVDFAQGTALARGRSPATRPVFLRLHGVAHGTFEICPALAPELRVGLFGHKHAYPVWVRFSSDRQPGSPDLKGTVGIAIKLFDVAGPKLLEPDRDAHTHDFLLQNHDVFFVDTAKDMCEFTCQSLNGKFDEYVAAHPTTGQVLDAMEKVVDSVLATPYWSGLPSRFGAKHFVKYKLEPEAAPGNPDAPNYNDPFFLRADLHERLRAGEARFRFLVQFQTDEATMPLDRATVRWCERASPPVHVATLVLPAQDLDTRNQSQYGENLAFNPWHALAEHEPIGSIAAARKVVYLASANVRRNFDGVPLGEPVTPRPGEWMAGQPYPQGVDTVIVRAAIHPAIGIARVGNSPEDFFVGPEVAMPAPKPAGFYRDAKGALKRQAARFRIYGYNAAGQVVGELTSDTADIHWTVHVANSKAAWYQWSMALDVPEAAGTKVPLRNADVADRNRLIIDSGPRTITGKNTSGAAFAFHGKFQDTDVYLGELRTDAAGHLLFLGGRGVSASPTGSPIFIEGQDSSFINADGWYDDMSDGPVTAMVNIEGRSIPVEAAWVVTAPPNYAPGLIGLRSLDDLLRDLNIEARLLPSPSDKPSFRHDIYPLLRRLTDLQWVNKGYATEFGQTGPYDFANPTMIERLNRDPALDGYDLERELRNRVFRSFRDPDGEDSNQLPWPWIYGDSMQIPAANTPRQNAAVSRTQFRALKNWAKGSFVADWHLPVKDESTLTNVDPADRPAMLDRAALTHCLADAFHPGCELTWPIRHLTLFSAPFRIRQRSVGAPIPNYGPQLTPEIALSATGPLHEQGPGDLTRWMGLPWQADTGFCRSGYDRRYDPFVPTFWPARVPNQVLTPTNYEAVLNTTASRPARLRAFDDRMLWESPLDVNASTADQMEAMVRLYGDMGLIEIMPGVIGDPVFPTEMRVASFGPGIPTPSASSAGTASPKAAAIATAPGPAKAGKLPLPVRYARPE